LCPTGKLRAALIASNPVLVTRRPDGTLGGVSVAIAGALASHLNVPVELKPYDNPARYNESLATDGRVPYHVDCLMLIGSLATVVWITLP
jgi:polar amino acid transport system substrate-binding protein